MEDWPNNLPKIWKIRLAKIYGTTTNNACDNQTLIIYQTQSCNPIIDSSDWMGPDNLINSDSLLNLIPAPYYPNYSAFVPLISNVTCTETLGGTGAGGCGPSSTGSITFTQIPNQIQLTFDTYGDYIHYKNSLAGTDYTLSIKKPETWYKLISTKINH